MLEAKLWKPYGGQPTKKRVIEETSGNSRLALTIAPKLGGKTTELDEMEEPLSRQASDEEGGLGKRGSEE